MQDWASHGSSSWSNAILVIQQGFVPDSISTDLRVGSMNRGMKDMTNVMSKILNQNVPLADVIRMSTINPATQIKRPELGLGAGRVTDPNALALEIRRILGREQRVIDVWNGITVLAAPYEEPAGRSVLVTALNYAYQPLPVQMRVRGTFSVVQYESPAEGAALLPYIHIAGYTEFLLPALRIGARVFLSQELQ